ncbi:hypothetical protein D9B98_12230 [Corynebacterium diphtheriae]|nr:chloramphenicol resistance leader peptide [Corynebacterium diphtheriae bv. mitis]RKW82021.1 hypothetical protein D9B95_12230 [Corynebacterium diphtheriae]RKX04976.1 hypothetical protein D9B98_12230 [Corynebacterium diphtheriae]
MSGVLGVLAVVTRRTIS